MGHSRVARDVAIVSALFGTVIYAFGALSGGPALLVVRYLGQALPLLTTQVRQHVSR